MTTTAAHRPIRLAIINDYEVVIRGVAEMFSGYSDRIQIVELDAQLTPVSPVDIALCDAFAMPQGARAQLEPLFDSPVVGKVVVYSWNAQHR